MGLFSTAWLGTAGDWEAVSSTGHISWNNILETEYNGIVLKNGGSPMGRDAHKGICLSKKSKLTERHVGLLAFARKL